MKNLLFAFFLLFGLTALQAQTLAVAVVPKATIYSQPDASSTPVAFLSQADLCAVIIYGDPNTDNIFEPQWYMTTLSNGVKAFVCSDEVAIFTFKYDLPIMINETQYYLLIAAQQLNYGERNAIFTPFLYNPRGTQKAIFLYSSTSKFSLGCANTYDMIQPNILQYGSSFCNSLSDRTSLTLKDNLLELKTEYSGFDSDDDRVSGSGNIYMTIKAAENGQFWAFQTFPPNQDITQLRQNVNLYGVAYQLSINQNINYQTDEIHYTPLLQNVKTGKTYYIYAKSPKQLDTFFDKPYMSIASFIGDDGDWVLSAYGGNIILSMGTESFDGEPTEADIYWYNLDFSNGKITATLIPAQEKHIKLK